MKTEKGQPSSVRSALFMDTVVNVKIIGPEGSYGRETNIDAQESLNQAFAAFRLVEGTMSRFDPDSELSQVSRSIGTKVPVSALLFEALRFGLQVAEVTDGAFDPTLGSLLVRNGFRRNYLTGQRWTPMSAEPEPSIDVAELRQSGLTNFRDVVLDEDDRTVLLKKPLLLDLGALAKGLAVDLAAKTLSEYQFDGFYVEAGGDLFAAGLNEHREPWRVGIQHPLKSDQHLATVRLSNEAICTSGSYERNSPTRPGSHHLIDPHSGQSPLDWYSCSVIAPFAMLADAFSTAAFVLGPEKGRQTLEAAGLTGVFISRQLELVMTDTLRRYLI